MTIDNGGSGDVAMIPNEDIMFDEGIGIDDAVSFNDRVRVDECAMHDDRPFPNPRMF